MISRKLTVLLVPIVVLLGEFSAVQADDWPEFAYPFDDFTPGPASMTFMGIALLNGGDASTGDIIAAFDQDGTPAGASELTVNGGVGYINLPIYGDDSGTSDVDEGIGAGDNFYLVLYDASENMLYSMND